MRIRFVLCCLSISLFSFSLCGQQRGAFRVMFYNTENLFDTKNDKSTNDDEFTPTGRLKWTNERYAQKLVSVFKVISGVGGDTPPEIIGLCEVENKQVLQDLITKTPLNKFPFQIIHHDSPDPRGIDVALLYRTDKVKPLWNKSIPIHFPGKNRNHRTRDILLTAYSMGKDTLYVFVNHWPSRRSGEIESEYFRVFVGQRLKQEVDSLFDIKPNAKILIMGDLNDEPHDKSLTQGLGALPISQTILNKKLYNLAYNYNNPKKLGTHKFKAKWEIFDQLIVSGNMLNAKSKLVVNKQCASIYSEEFLLKADNQNLGFNVFKTYAGFKYLGGFSDHLPVYIDILMF